jgi:hypothetical protein
VCNFIHKFNIGPNRKNISQLILSETVEAFVCTFGCVLGGSLQNIWSEDDIICVASKIVYEITPAKST